jgi:hypothetical protein
MISAQINKSDLRRLEQKLSRLAKYSQKDFDRLLGETAAKAAELAINKAPVDMGQLKGSIHYAATKNNVSVWVQKKYAPYVEFGTGGFVNVTDATQLGISPAQIESEFKGSGFVGQKPVFIRDKGSMNGNWRMVTFPISLKPQPFFFGSVRSAYAMLLQKLEKDFKHMTK